MWQYNVIPKLLDRWQAESRGVNELYRSPLHLSTAVHVCKADSVSLAVKLLGGKPIQAGYRPSRLAVGGLS
jgi:hypothetical protein